MAHFGAVRACRAEKHLKDWLICGAVVLSSGFLALPARAQTSVGAVTIGQVVGGDISVIGPSSPVMNGSMPAIEFLGGGTIVVHSGKARVEFIGGGELDVCGPAKFTVLSSDQALTVALSFGRVHARFDASRPITIYTPVVLATPMSLGDRPRDATIGVANTGTMCVRAARGAVRLQNQLSGETVIVPQPSEVVLEGPSFGTLPPAVGQCRCDFDEPSARQATPLVPALAPASAVPLAPGRSAPVPVPVSPKPPAPASPASGPVSAQRQGTVSLPQTANPLPAAAKSSVPSSARPSPGPRGQTATIEPMLKINLPPIGYDAQSGTAAAEPLSVATLMLAQEAIVQPQWVFHGTVVTPGEERAARVLTTTQTRAAAKPKKKGFWARFRNFFAGSG